jgi:A/G-specific adenine glycosylase
MTALLEEPIAAWYAENGRDLPWRRPGVGAWPIMVSEFMLQQTPVSRVLPAYEAWIDRWPTPRALAAATAADAVRQWDRLGYPRRALRLHESAVIITATHAGEVPHDITALRSLPGVGTYTAAAIATFAYAQRHPVLDTNVRRVLSRLLTGIQYPPASLSVAEQSLAESLLPPETDRRAATWSVALMELGALICTATRPTCESCPIAPSCAWLSKGRPAGAQPRRAQPYEGSDRQLRGQLLAVLRTAAHPVLRSAFTDICPEQHRLDKVLEALIADGLATQLSSGLIALPGESLDGAGSLPCID